METATSTRHTRPQFVPRNRVILNFPKESDTQSYWDILEQLDWLQYVEGENRPEEKKKKSINFFDLTADIPADNRPLEEIREEIFTEKYGLLP